MTCTTSRSSIPPPFNKAVFESLKPGGTYIVIDHSAAKGAALRDTSTLHRIDEESVKTEVKAAGFEYRRQQQRIGQCRPIRAPRKIFRSGDPRQD